MVAFAKNIAKAERIPEFRNFIKRQAEKLIGQEQIVLYLQVVDSVIYGTTTFAQLMDKISDTFGYNYSYNYYRTELPDMLPRLTITVYTGGEYVDIENWTYTEPIQVLPWTENLKAINEAYGTSYDQYFNEYSVSNFDDPDSSMLVIEDNNSLWLVDESYRIIGFGQVTSSDTFFQYHLFELTDTIEHYLEYPHELPDSIKIMVPLPAGWHSGQIMLSYNDVIDMLNLYNNTQAAAGDPYCECDRGKRDNREEVYQVRLDDNELDKFCPWTKKECKIQITTTFPVLNGSTYTLTTYPKKYLKCSRKYIRNDQRKKFYFKTYKFQYCEEIHGDNYFFYLIGKNSNAGNTTTVTFSTSSSTKDKDGNTVVGSTSVSMQIKDNDNDLGGDVVEFCDPANYEGTMYDLGTIKVWMKEIGG